MPASNARWLVGVRFSIVMTVFDTFPLLARAMSCVAWQTVADWELLIVVDGSGPVDTFAPRHLAKQMRRAVPGRRVDVWELPRAEGCFGNVGRAFALEHARGEYVCWVNHDNLIAPGYVDTSLTDRTVARIQERTGRSAEDARRAVLALSPQRRLVEADEIAPMVRLLASDAGRSITGACIAIDGGASAFAATGG